MRVEWQRLNIVSFKIFCCAEKEGVHSLNFILLHLGRNALPVRQVVGVLTLRSYRANTMEERSRQSIVVIFCFFFQRLQFHRELILENFSDGSIDFTVHFQDVLSAN